MREKELLLYFSVEEELVFCDDIKGLLLKMGVPRHRALLIYRQFEKKFKI